MVSLQHATLFRLTRQTAIDATENVEVTEVRRGDMVETNETEMEGEIIGTEERGRGTTIDPAVEEVEEAV
jgi:hypothetical protein